MVDIFGNVKTMEEQAALDNNLLQYIGQAVDDSYLTKVTNLSVRKDISKKASDFKIVYTPLHGSGLMLVTKALSMLGYENVHLVESQVTPDGSFPTVKSPNPEDREALNEGVKLAEKINADIILGTDPDSDRVGVVIKNNNGEYQGLTGNQIGALLSYYLLSSKGNVTKKDAVVKTIVTSELGATIAKEYGASVFNTLTGFKFIGEKIKEFEQDNKYNFVFGYEESYGYLAGTFVRDKDAVIASVLIVEMAAYYKTKGMSLFDAINEIYERFGYFNDSLESFVFKGSEGQQKIKDTVESFRDYKALTKAFDGILIIEDYLFNTRNNLDKNIKEEIHLPKENVIKVFFKDGSWFAIRPSGTEPKLKIYYSTMGKTNIEAAKRMEELKSLINKYIKKT